MEKSELLLAHSFLIVFRVGPELELQTLVASRKLGESLSVSDDIKEVLRFKSSNTKVSEVKGGDFE